CFFFPLSIFFFFFLFVFVADPRFFFYFWGGGGRPPPPNPQILKRAQTNAAIRARIEVGFINFHLNIDKSNLQTENKHFNKFYKM
ncbi:hypothetical protein, partial [Chryseobacterium sp. MMO-55]|uniref:hypothetical protein n=1 Tax=Chryseobacterium sp. MMO-55 TaxID=3081252 RepID=UPI00301A1469